MQHATTPARLLLFALSAIIIAMVISAQRGRKLFIRRIPGLSAIDEAVGRAVEMGRPLLASLGLGGLDIVTLQGLAIVTNVARIAARFGARMMIPLTDPAMLAVTEDAIGAAYNSVGRGDAFSGDDIMYLSGQQFAYAAGVAGMINREQTAAIFYFGLFYAESLIMAENGNQVGAVQVAGTTQTTQIPFFIAACDYVIIGDEYYAATAYLTREPTLLGSIVGQDIAKGVLLAMLVIGAVLFSFHNPLMMNFFGDNPLPSLAQYLHSKGGK
jgi:hypothetical protein